MTLDEALSEIDRLRVLLAEKTRCYACGDFGVTADVDLCRPCLDDAAATPWAADDRAYYEARK